MHELRQQVKRRSRESIRQFKHHHIFLRIARTIEHHLELPKFLLSIRIKHLYHPGMNHIEHTKHPVTVPRLAYVNHRMVRMLLLLADHLPLHIRKVRYVIENIVAPIPECRHLRALPSPTRTAASRSPST